MAKFCPNCGAELNEGADVCLKCGKAINNSSNACSNPNAKSKVAAGVLGLTLGWLGIHNFYLGYTGKGVAQLLLSILTCGILLIPVYIWGLIEGIQILTGSINVDAQGNPLKD